MTVVNCSPTATNLIYLMDSNGTNAFIYLLPGEVLYDVPGVRVGSGGVYTYYQDGMIHDDILMVNGTTASSMTLLAGPDLGLSAAQGCAQGMLMTACIACVWLIRRGLRGSGGYAGD